MKVAKLPLESKLYKMYDEFKEKYFDGYYELPSKENVTIKWSNRLTSSAGNCYRSRKLIQLSKHYHLKFPNEVGATLLHEMMHLVAPGHGKKFKAVFNHIQSMGGKVFRHSKEPALIKYIYYCANCDFVYKKSRKLKYSIENYRCPLCKSEIKEIKVEN